MNKSTPELIFFLKAWRITTKTHTTTLNSIILLKDLLEDGQLKSSVVRTIETLKKKTYTDSDITKSFKEDKSLPTFVINSINFGLKTGAMAEILTAAIERLETEVDILP